MDENAIFFFDAKGESGEIENRAVDPFHVERYLAAGLGGEKIGAVLQQAESPPSPLSLMAGDKLFAAIQMAFGIKGVQPDGSGCNEKMQVRILKDYLRWKAEVKKNIASSAISSTRPTGSTPEEDSPQSNCLPCGSTEEDVDVNGQHLSLQQ